MDTGSLISGWCGAKFKIMACGLQVFSCASCRPSGWMLLTFVYDSAGGEWRVLLKSVSLSQDKRVGSAVKVDA